MRSRTPVAVAEVGRLPLVLGPVEAGRMLGLGRTLTYQLLREGAFPVPAHKRGRNWIVPTAGVLVHLGLDIPNTTGRGCSRCGARSDHTKGES